MTFERRQEFRKLILDVREKHVHFLLAAARRVVIAEDEVLIRMDLAEMLAEEGYDVVGQAGDGAKASTSFTRLPEVVKQGDTLFLNDGIVQLEVLEVSGAEVRCRVAVGGEIRSRVGLNLPGILG